MISADHCHKAGRTIAELWNVAIRWRTDAGFQSVRITPPRIPSTGRPCVYCTQR